MHDERPSWQPPPDVVTLHEADVHVWRIGLDGDIAATDDATLSADERERAARYRFPHLTRRFVASRAATRAILARCLGLPAAAIRFAYDDGGKPRLADPAFAQSVAFNVSHSDDLALVAVTAGRSVGIDIERVASDRDRFATPRRYFSAVETASLLALPPDERQRACYRCWTRKEAFMKACGEGLSLSLDAFDVSCRPDEPPQILEVRSPHLRERDWILNDVPAHDDFAAALVVEGTACRLRLWRWDR
jgi:4'-phosphopantetheinyl transferase